MEIVFLERSRVKISFTHLNLEKKKIIVVGAGLAGLAAAYDLSKSHHVTVVEARDRIGGRVFSLNLKGVDVDLGGFMIFPWYKNYRRYCKELGIDNDLKRIPNLEIYYDFGEGYFSESDLGLSSWGIAKMAIKVLPESFLGGSLASPNLDHFKGKSVAEYIEKLVKNPEERVKYMKLFDTIAQGYTYPSIEDYQAAFGVPIYPKVLISGDSNDCDIFTGGSMSLPNALAESIKKNGGEIILGRAVLDPKNEFEADAYLLAKTADSEMDYTNFTTVIVELDDRYQENLTDWGALFITANGAESEVLSLIDMEKLYGAESLKAHYIFNIKSGLVLNEKSVLNLINDFLKTIRVKNVLVIESWKQAMPISREDYVKKVKNSQGIDNIFYAGDFLGCPSMETAVTTGKLAAEKILKSF